MFEARLVQGRILKLLVEAIKDLVTDANLDASEEELSLQCMDSSHVSLVSLSLPAAAFDQYRCDRHISLGFNSANMAKICKFMNSDDIVTLKADDEGDTLTLMFENEKAQSIADFEMKLMDIDTEQLCIPDTSFKCTIQMPSKQFEKLMRDLGQLGDTCTISCTKEGVRFSVTGELGTANVLVRANAAPEKDEDRVLLDMEEPVELNFAMRYLTFFTKATPLSSSVIISMSPDIPIVVEYPILEDSGFIKFYLAPKIDEDNNNNGNDE